jgi:hypothetical protein
VERTKRIVASLVFNQTLNSRRSACHFAFDDDRETGRCGPVLLSVASMMVIFPTLIGRTLLPSSLRQRACPNNAARQTSWQRARLLLLSVSFSGCLLLWGTSRDSIADDVHCRFGLRSSLSEQEDVSESLPFRCVVTVFLTIFLMYFRNISDYISDIFLIYFCSCVSDSAGFLSVVIPLYFCSSVSRSGGFLLRK